MFEYDVAISFAGEQRPETEAIADCLRKAQVRVFYDGYEQTNLWGKDLYEHLSEVYQKKAQYCLMLVSAAYAAKVWPNHERKNVQARALSQRVEYILPVRFDETEIPGLPNTIAYLQFKKLGVEGICTHVLQKLRASPGPSEKDTLTKRASDEDSTEFLKQRRGLPDTAIMRKIWSKPRWHIWIRPTQFKKARFRTLDHCREFMVSSYVRVQGCFPYPWFSGDSLESGDEWIAGEMDMCDGGVSRVERWALFRSAQFIHNRAFDEIRQLADRVHVLEILDTATAAFEFAARMANRGVLSPEAEITFTVHGLDGRGLAWPQDVFGGRDAVQQECWCADESFSLSRIVPAAQLEARRREIALDAALEIYSRFAWSDPPKERLVDAQRKRFGAAEPCQPDGWSRESSV
jgi:hypothetical protein